NNATVDEGFACCRSQIGRGSQNPYFDQVGLPSIVAAVSGRQRHRHRLILSTSSPPSSPGSQSSSLPSSSSSQHQ
ncbi:hypothetical protein HN51_068790, partial [Arachis hypogaea]